MEKKELEALPGSDSDFWASAEVIKAEPKHFRCDHVFRYVGTNRAECKKCNTGYALGPGWNIKNNKIYFNETFVF